MKYAIMFDVLQGGEIEPIKWNSEKFNPEKSIILLEEMTPAVWLWHGENQTLIARRVASRQAEALKGYGYIFEGAVIGSRTRIMNEIDARKLGKDPITDELNIEFQKILKMEFNPLNDFIVKFQKDTSEIKPLEIRKTPESLQAEKIESKEKIKRKIEPMTEKLVEAKIESTMLDDSPKISVEKQKDIKPEMTRKPTKPIRKTEFSFESYIQEMPEPSIKMKEEEIDNLSKALNSSNIIQDILIRIKNLEDKLDLLIEKFKNVEEIIKKNKNP